MAGRTPSPTGGANPWTWAEIATRENNKLATQAMQNAQTTTSNMQKIEAGRQEDLFKTEAKNSQRRYKSGKSGSKNGMPNPASAVTDQGFPEKLIVRPSMLDLPGLLTKLEDHYEFSGNSDDRYNSSIYVYSPEKSAKTMERNNAVKNNPGTTPRTLDEAEKKASSIIEEDE